VYHLKSILSINIKNQLLFLKNKKPLNNQGFFLNKNNKNMKTY